MGDLALALALTAAAAEGRPMPSPPPIPSEDVVLALRKARIADSVGAEEARRHLIDDLLAAHPGDPTVLASALTYYQKAAPDAPETRSLRARLVEATAEPGRAPLPVIRDLARDPKASDADLAGLLETLKARPVPDP